MSWVESFDVVVGVQPKALILGSMPGTASLTAVQYYAHPRNAFWPIVLGFFQLGLELSYAQRVAALQERGIALWDVLQRCERIGSLDSAINRRTEQTNDIAGFLHHYPTVRTVLLNGGKAAKSYHRNFSKSTFYHQTQALELPSTSPAYAAMPFLEKQDQWHLALRSVFGEN